MRRVAITGLGAITPIGNSVQAFYQSLLAGACGIGPITHFDASAFKAKLAAEVKDFDPDLFGMPPKRSRHLDLFAQYALAAAKQAAEDSGICGAVAPERLGVYVGSGIGGMNTFLNQANQLRDRGPERVSPFFITMLIGNIAAGQIAIEYGALGPSLPTVTACATSANAIGEAYRAIAHGYADAIIAGGAEATIEPLSVAGFINCQALSLADDPLVASIPFDRRRSGFVMGEGAGILVLEELENAQKRGARIYGELCGYGNTLDGYHITAPRPDGSGAARAMAMAAEQAGLQGGERLYINAHGTSTPLNDASETLAIKLALGEEQARAVKISSTKSMTGHMLGAAGAVEAIASLLALNSGIIPPTIGYHEPDPECDLDYTANAAVEFRPEIALSTSLGFGGHNACLAFRRIGD
ncbi:MAG: beta-ketoacyl-ACP synthase II [Christensenellaceae bacterium]|jgi:3-oxoacyl-[acyl-carrier-protein] synthase II|nr:beta-ketoacyl-ACP synthase II [Christensenellaceae bacterium]